MGASVQLMGIIRTLLDPENMLASVNKVVLTLNTGLHCYVLY